MIAQQSLQWALSVGPCQLLQWAQANIFTKLNFGEQHFPQDLFPWSSHLLEVDRAQQKSAAGLLGVAGEPHKKQCRFLGGAFFKLIFFPSKWHFSNLTKKKQCRFAFSIQFDGLD
jgi:hypothetical protein